MPVDRADDTTRETLARRVNEVLDLPASLHESGSPPDKYLLQCDPTILAGTAELIARRLPSDIEVLVGVETGGLAVAAAVSLVSWMPWAVARRASGEVRVRDVVGGSVADRRVAVVKDAVMGGGSLLPIAEPLRHHGAVVTAVGVGLAWDPTLGDRLRSAGVTAAIALTRDDLSALWSR